MITEIEKLEITELAKAYVELEQIKLELVREYRGATESTEQKGYWINDKEQLELDRTLVFSVLTNNTENLEACSCVNDERLDISTRINHSWLSSHVSHWKTLEQQLERIKSITKQYCQFFAIDNTPFSL